MAHLLLHKCYIHSVFCYIDRNFFELLAAGWKGLSAIPWNLTQGTNLQ